MAETINCKALVAFTRHVTFFGMVHGDPESEDKAATHPAVPVEAVDQLVEDGFIEAPAGKKAKKAASEAPADAAPSEDAPAA